MWRTIPIALFCWLSFPVPSHGQDVFVPRELKAVAVKPPVVQEQPSEVRARKALPADEAEKGARPATAPAVKTAAGKEQPARRVLKAEPVTEPEVKAPPVKEQPTSAPKAKTQTTKAAPITSAAVKTTPVKAQPSSAATAKSQVAKTETVTPPAVKTAPVKEQSASAPTAKTQVAKIEMAAPPAVKTAPLREQSASAAMAKSQVAKTEPVTPPTVKTLPVKEQPASAPTAKTQAAKVELVTVPSMKSSGPAKERSATAATAKSQVVKTEPVKALTAKTASLKETSSATTTKTETAKTEPPKVAAVKETSANPPPTRAQPLKVEPTKVQSPQEPTVNVQLVNGPMETAFTKLADGFDFPVGKPEAEGYYKARGFRSGGHMGEDWDGVRGGDTDFNDPIYSIGDGIVVFARDVHLGWGNVVIVRHAYRENGTVKHIDSLYGHLNKILVSRGQRVVRGQQVGNMGTAHGQYDAHLHLEIRKNLEIGMSRSKFQKNLSNYYDPSQFIASHRHLSGGGANFRVAMNTFTHDSAYHFDTARNFSARKRSNAESTAALKRAISSTTH